MIVVGELINASRKTIAAAIEKQDSSVIQQVALGQVAAGANYIDVNAGIFVGKEAGYLKWLTATVQAAVETPCVLDSPDPQALQTALAVHKGIAMINTFMAMAIARGLDGAIVNPLDQRMMGTIMAAEALAERDNYCMKYLKAHRAGVFELKSSQAAG